MKKIAKGSGLIFLAFAVFSALAAYIFFTQLEEIDAEYDFNLDEDEDGASDEDLY